MTLVVHYQGAFEDIRLARFEDRVTAYAARFPSRFAFVVEREDDLLGLATCTPDGEPQSCTLTGAGCARIYNAFADEPVDGRFTNRTAGAKRTWRLLMNIEPSLPMEHREDKVIMEVQEQEKKPRRRAGLTPLGQPAQVKVGTHTALVLGEAMKSGTLAEIAEASGVPEAKTATILRSTLRVNHGIRVDMDSDGNVLVVLPTGYDAESIFKAKGEPKARKGDGGPRRTKNTELDEAAARGEFPEKPVVLSETNAHRQKHFDKLYELAGSGDWDGVAAYHMKGIDTYSKSINRYRDRLLAAHAAQQSQRAAE